MPRRSSWDSTFPAGFYPFQELDIRFQFVGHRADDFQGRAGNVMLHAFHIAVDRLLI